MKARGSKNLEVVMEQGMELIEFYRNNPCIAAYELLGVDLAPIQRVIFEDMWFKNYSISVCGRGTGKTFLLGTLAALSCLLYPGYRVGLIGSVFRQSKMIFSEVEKLYAKSPILREACEKKPTRGSDAAYLRFKFTGGMSGSYIEALPLGDGCLTSGNYLTFSDRFGTISDSHGEGVISNHYIDRKEMVWGNGKFRKSDKSLCNGVKDTIIIKTKKGFKSEGTKNHMFKVVRFGRIIWCYFDEMNVGDKILIDRSYRWHEGDGYVTKEEAYALGVMIGDGSWTNKYYLRFTTKDTELIESVRNGTGFSFTEENKDGVHYNHNSKQDRLNWLDFWGMEVSYAVDKKLPDKILSTSRKIMSACISGLYDSDGHVQISTTKGGIGITIGFTNTSKELVDQLHYILLHYGIVAYRTERDRDENWNTVYELLITGSDVKIFYEEIGFGLKRKQNILEAAVRNKIKWVKNDNIPGIRQDMIRLSEENRVKKGLGCKESRYCKAYTLKRKKVINQYLAECFIKTYGHIDDPAVDKIKERANSDIYYDEIVFIEKGEDVTYDIHVPDGNEYCANGFFSHNSKIRGSRFYLICVDELAQVPDKILDMVVRPMGATTLEPMENVRRVERQRKLIELGLATEDDFEEDSVNKMVMTSSGFYKFNHMWRRMKDYWRQMEIDGDDKSKYTIHQIPHWDLPEGFLDKDNIDEARRVMSNMEFRMEYEAHMASESEGFFKASLLEACTLDSGFSIEARGKSGAQYIVGVDPNQAGRTSSCGICIVKLGTINKLVNVLELKKKTTQDITKTVQDVCKDYNVLRVFMDKGGGGKAVCDLLEDGYGGYEPLIDRTNKDHEHMQGRHILEMINFNPGFISDANFTTLSLLEDKSLRFPEPPISTLDLDAVIYERIKTLKSQMLNIIITQTSSGLLHFDTPKKGQKKDLYSALILAAHGVRMFEKEMNPEPEPILFNSGLVRKHEPGAQFAPVGSSGVGNVVKQDLISMAVLVKNKK